MKHFILVDNEGFVLCEICHSIEDAIARAKSFLDADCYFPSKWINIHDVDIVSAFVVKRVTVFRNGNVIER